MKKFLAMVMALCMVCMTVVVASAATEFSSVDGIESATVDGVKDQHVGKAGLTSEQETELDKKANVSGRDQRLSGKLKVEGEHDVTIHLTTSPGRLSDTKVYWLDANGQWQEVPATRSGNDVTTKFPSGFSGVFSIVQYISAGSGSGSTGADVKAPQTNDVSVELMLAAGMLLFGTIAVAARKRHAA